MENLLEIIFPLIVAAVYFFSNMFGKREDDGGQPGRPVNRDLDSEEAERQRQIREEIRRKILERQQKPKAPEAPAVPAGVDAVEQPRSVTPPPMPKVRTAETGTRAEAEPTFRWEQPATDVYAVQMAQQLQQIEATKRAAERLKVANTVEVDPVAGKRSGGSRVCVDLPIKASLRDPAAARRAFIYSEVLGKPVGAR